jgi:hypothetical protein
VAARTIMPEVAPDWSGGVLESFYRVVFARPDAEIAGFLVGRVGAHGAARVDAVIPLHEAGLFGVGATFSHPGWAHAHSVMARHYRGLEIVGWYVSRPGRGTALTGPELAEHARWFPHPHNIVLVVDSAALRGALLGRHDGRIVELHEGPIQRRYTHAAPHRAPWRAYLLLAACGSALGAGAHLLITQAL